MIDKWFSTIELPLTFEQSLRLPQNPAYKYEYFDHHAWLTPRPKGYHAILDLKSFVRPIDNMATDEDVSTLWHWRAGFRLLPYPGSMRVIREQVARRGDDGEQACDPTTTD